MLWLQLSIKESKQAASPLAWLPPTAQEPLDLILRLPRACPGGGAHHGTIFKPGVTEEPLAFLGLPICREDGEVQLGR